MEEGKQEHCLWLTEDEAMGLLDIAVMSLSELSPEQRAAIGKLSEFCRQCLRDEKEASSVPPRLKMVTAPGALAA